MSTARAAWLQAYATILAGLAANDQLWHSWEDLRQRARTETNEACRVLGVSIAMIHHIKTGKQWA